jgi:hypothetical protein
MRLEADREQRVTMKGSARDRLNVATFVAAAVAAIATGFAAFYTEEQASIAGDMERRQLRAYVAMSGIALQPFDTPGGKREWTEFPIWKNSGLTPTRGLRIVHMLSAHYSQGPTVITADQSTFVLAPQDEASPALGAVGPTNGHFVAEGIAVYRDVFGYYHVSRSCRFANIFADWSGKIAGEKIVSESVPCDTGNCADEECEPFRADISKAVKERLGITIPLSAFRS